MSLRKIILLKHYRTSDGTVTANQILRMFDVVRTGSKRKSQGNVVYSKVFRKNGVEYRTVVKIFPNRKNTVLKSFHSTIEKKKKKVFRPACCKLQWSGCQVRKTHIYFVDSAEVTDVTSPYLTFETTSGL